MIDPYEELELPSGAPIEIVRAAYRKLAQKWHPDKHPNNVVEATKKFQLIEEAYRMLEDPARKAKYDDLGEQFDDALQVAAADLLLHLEKQLVENSDVNHIKVMRQMLDQTVQKQTVAIANMTMNIRTMERVAKRWRKKKGRSRNIFANMYARKIEDIKHAIKDSEHAIEIANASRKMLDGYEFFVEEYSAVPIQPFMISFRP